MSGWSIFADPWISGELGNLNKFQTIKFNKNIILIAIKTWIAAVGNPNFSNLRMAIYGNSATNTPKQLLFNSTNSFSKADIFSKNNAIKEIYFEFNSVPINGTDYYNFVISGSDYVYTSASHLAWVKGWPDPVYTENFTPTFVNSPTAPYQIYAIGGDL